jgi:hypothetical protein
MQYPETLPLNDHEVVLTFDDGPVPRYTSGVLKALASECVRATFFMVGQMARAYPSMAIGDPQAVSPFFRIPGLLRQNSVEQYLAAHGDMTWSADFLADDWTRINNSEVARRAINRIEARRKGILLLHDIHPRTVPRNSQRDEKPRLQDRSCGSGSRGSAENRDPSSIRVHRKCAHLRQRISRRHGRSPSRNESHVSRVARCRRYHKPSSVSAASPWVYRAICSIRFDAPRAAEHSRAAAS